MGTGRDLQNERRGRAAVSESGERAAMIESAERAVTESAERAAMTESAKRRAVTESAEPAPGEHTVVFWRDLMDRYARTVSALERRLEDEHGLGVSEFEVLERLAAPHKENRRMQELAESVHLSQSALSRVVGRLEADGLVTRKLCPEDRRGIYACLTDEGRSRYEAARPTHRAVLADTLG